jgi:hypothetical protein
MKPPKYLREGILRTLECPVAPILEEHFDPATIRRCPLAYCLYIDKGHHLEMIDCLLMPATEGPVGYIDNFSAFLARQSPDNFRDLLSLLDIYHFLLFSGLFSGFTEVPDLPAHSKMTGLLADEMMESFVNDSKGYLIWHHQLENILCLNFRIREDALELRKDLNARKAEAWSRLKDIGSGELYSFINSRMIFGHTKKPNIAGAARLYELFLSE